MPFSTTAITAGPYVANGITTTFAFGFRCISESEIEVVLIASPGVETVISGYDITGVGENDGGAVVFEVAPSSAAALWVRAKPSGAQEVVLSDQSAYSAADLEDAVDRLAQGLLLNRLLAAGGLVDWNNIYNKPAYGVMARADGPWKVVDDWIAAAQATTQSQVAAAINACMATAVTGDKFVFPSPQYDIFGKINYPNVNDVYVWSGGKSMIVQHKDNEPIFEMRCVTTVGGFGLKGFRGRWATNQSVAYDAGLGHLAGDTNAIFWSFLADGADGNGEYNFVGEDLTFENGFRGVSPNYDETILGGEDFPLWGARFIGIHSYQGMQGAALAIGNFGSGGGPRYTIDDLYDNAAHPCEASILMNKTAGCKIGAAEFNNTVDMARIVCISARGNDWGSVRFEHMTLATRNNALIILSSPDSGRAKIGQLEITSPNITVGPTKEEGLVYGVMAYAGSEVQVDGDVIVQYGTGNTDKLAVFWPRTDAFNEGEEVPPGRPYPPGKVFVKGGLFMNEGPDGSEWQGRSHDNIFDGPNIRFADETELVFGVAAGDLIGDTAFHKMGTAVPGFSDYKMTRRGWVPHVNFEVVTAAPITSGYVTMVLCIDDVLVNWVRRTFGPAGVTDTLELDLYIPFGRYNDALYGGGGDDDRDVWFSESSRLSIKYACEFPGGMTPDLDTISLRAAIIIASRSGTIE